MKLYFFVFFFAVTLPEALFSQDTLVKYFDKDWNEISNKEIAVYYRSAFVDSNKTWFVNDYFMSKQIQMSGTYKSKKLKIRHGYFTYYYENGKIKSEGKYSNDNQEGNWIYYYDNGEKAAEGKYFNNKKGGIWNYWYTSGQLNYVETYIKRGIVSVIGYFENGEINYKGNYIKGVRQGEWTYWNVDGRIFFKGTYTNGNQNGKWIRYFPDGEMKIFYVHGVPKDNVFGGMVLSK